MKKIPFIVAVISTFILEVFICLFTVGKIEATFEDPVQVNECIYSIQENFGDTTKYSGALNYVVFDNEWRVLYKTSEGLSESRNEAIKNNDLILDLEQNGNILGKVVIHNETTAKVRGYKDNIIFGLMVIFVVQLVLILAYFIYLKQSILKPFKKLESFATRVAAGNLDLPLELDRKHVFGSFSEAFDLMRAELKKARIAEKKANDEKKEVIAKLSHDIKTPVASIKSTSEFGYELTNDERAKGMFNQINVKSDQITTLVDNLFNSSVNDVTEITVNPYAYSSDILEEMIYMSDYLHRIDKGTISVPVCNVFCDKLRLQQTIDNVIMNSYKYADTKMQVEIARSEDYLNINISDFGGGVNPIELPLLKNKYKRGSNIVGKEGAGLGLYLADYFMEKMDGRLILSNNYETVEGVEKITGFTVSICLRTI